jgi:hypothetical protein
MVDPVSPLRFLKYYNRLDPDSQDETLHFVLKLTLLRDGSMLIEIFALLSKCATGREFKHTFSTILSLTMLALNNMS